ncbi:MULTISPECIES: hypothetical protein [unclassified Nitrobacter]|uniref:hypothetical protein n=1 Tax=unclassified Nitrobacter TaxID=2620411 RepID=UPI00103C6121|nr:MULTISPECIES: hypothetical protein [unclassified Nitrobacter]MCB1392454.1 hypothetical protein [Nitrobacter sp.]MCV0387673.1 hypothetical protein [Nitrobacter sp.]
MNDDAVAARPSKRMVLDELQPLTRHPVIGCDVKADDAHILIIKRASVHNLESVETAANKLLQGRSAIMYSHHIGLLWPHSSTRHS